jgi:hypothetical protein
MSRDSRPPGFDMTYRPEEHRRFGTSLRARLPAYAYATLAAGFATFVAYGHVAPIGSFAWRWVIEAQPHRPFSSVTFALIALVAGSAALLRAYMQGVVLGPDGIETRDLVALGVPKIRRLEWPMIDRFRFDASDRLIGVDLWNGTQEYLPEVGDRAELVRALVYVAQARAIPYAGAHDVEVA